MAKLTLAFKGTALKEFPITAREMTIGSDTGCDIHIDSLAVNAFHARVKVGAEGITIEDMDTKTGISVNGRKVNRTLLKHGDIVLVGKHTLTLEDYEALKATLTADQEAAAEEETASISEPAQAEPAGTGATQPQAPSPQPSAAAFMTQTPAPPEEAPVADDPQTREQAPTESVAEETQDEPVAETAAEQPLEEAATEPAAEQPPEEPATETAAEEPPQEAATETVEEETPEEPAPQKITAWLQILSGTAMGRTIRIKHSLTDLGKMGLPAALISRRQGNYHIANLEAELPLLVNDTDIGDDSYPLEDGAVITLGKTRIQFYLQKD